MQPVVVAVVDTGKISSNGGIHGTQNSNHSDILTHCIFGVPIWAAVTTDGPASWAKPDSKNRACAEICSVR